MTTDAVMRFDGAIMRVYVPAADVYERVMAARRVVGTAAPTATGPVSGEALALPVGQRPPEEGDDVGSICPVRAE